MADETSSFHHQTSSFLIEMPLNWLPWARKARRREQWRQASKRYRDRKTQENKKESSSIGESFLLNLLGRLLAYR
jgi:hypothetical protein